jgi:hypothetical protein
MTDIRAAAKAYVECKTFGHAWDEFNPINMRRPHFGWRLSLRCVRCGAERHDIIDSNGNVGSRSYEHPIDYKLATKGAKRPDLRMELQRRRRAEGRKKRSA